jgi:hypothetical protein
MVSASQSRDGKTFLLSSGVCTPEPTIQAMELAWRSARKLLNGTAENYGSKLRPNPVAVSNSLYRLNHTSTQPERLSHENI